MPGDMLEVTGERLVPDRQRGELVHAEHLARYRLAAQLAAGRRTLDAACGEGYGTAMLAAAGADAVGVDIDPETVRHARARYGLEFVEGDVSGLPFEDSSFDLVVSFETIEHVEDAEGALAELRRVLRDPGLLVISTPNKGRFLQGTEFHVREFTHDEFVELLGRTFARVEVLYQQNWLMSAVQDEDGLAHDDPDRPIDLEVVKLERARPGEELFTIALCGDAEHVVRPTAVAARVHEAHELAERLHRAEDTAEHWHTENARALEVMDEMRASASWRLTRPLRAVKSWLRRRD